jgi:hypothetical protein
MDSKIQYLRGQISGLTSQLAADFGKSEVLKLIGKANSLLNARVELDEPTNRDNVLALVTQLHAAVDSYNSANQISIETVEEIMQGYDDAEVTDE